MGQAVKTFSEAIDDLQEGPPTKKGGGSTRTISALLIKAVCRRLSQGKQVRRTLPEKGRLHVDRQLPFLCVYRRPDSMEDAGTDALVKGEAAYLIAPGSEEHRNGVAQLVCGVVKTMVVEFGALLIVEVWASPGDGKSSDPAVPTVPPKFRVLAPPSAAFAKTVDVLARRLGKIKVMKQSVTVEVVDDEPIVPPGMAPLLEPAEAAALNCWTIGLVVPPVYRANKTGQQFPLLMRQFRRRLGRALKETFYRFSHAQTTHRPPHYNELGRRAVVKAVWEIDRRLGEVSSAFDFLLQVTPVNSEDAWQTFQESGFQHTPEFHYRPAPFDPALLKRQLYQVPIERVEDPALQHIFQEKQQELDRKITMLAERDTPQFRYGSLQLFGKVEDDLFQLATELLARLPRCAEGESAKGQIDAEALATAARAEFECYRAVHPEFTAKVEVSRKAAGIMVSRGTLLINRDTRVARSRVEALLQHEVGTHLLTYFNGRAQPFRQLYSGLAGYDALQEGLAVLAEYLVGGLDRGRLRQLAARVVGVRHMIDGASFVETYQTLTHTFGFPPKNAFTIAMRVYRGGGLTKDAVYLRGLRQILAYLSRGGKLASLFVGKFAVNHVSVINELRLRQVLRDPPLCPRYMDNPESLERLASLAAGNKCVLDLIG